MHEDLAAIAGLKIGEAVARLSQEGQTSLCAKIADSSSRGLYDSGPMVSARLNSGGWQALSSRARCGCRMLRFFEACGF
jgi:hypothetical protein